MLQEAVDTLFLVEPSRRLCQRLHDRFDHGGRVRVLPGTLEAHVPSLKDARIDSILAVNVPEHIDEDVVMLRAASEILRAGGHLFLFVPAFQFLYGSLDRTFGHVRRYTRGDLIGKRRGVGYDVVTTRYMNVLGTLSWFMAGRVLRRRTLSPRAVAIADRTLVPLSATLERWVEPPFGQNLMVIARKPA